MPYQWQRSWASVIIDTPRLRLILCARRTQRGAVACHASAFPNALDVAAARERVSDFAH